MKEADKLSNLIKNGENRSAAAFLDSIYESSASRDYAECLIKVTLVKTVDCLNSTVAGFYCDEEALTEKIFSRTPFDAKNIINDLCLKIKEAQIIDRERCFQKAESFIKQHFTESQFSVGNAAEYAGVSQSSLAKLFGEKLGTTPMEYVTKLRVNKSMDILQKDKSVEEASYAVGFSTVETYIRAFKRCCGTTPGQWKRNKLFL